MGKEVKSKQYDPGLISMAKQMASAMIAEE